MSSARDPIQRKSCWKSLLSVLLDGGAAAMDIYLAEVAPGGKWDFAFWNYGPDGEMCTYRCKAGGSIWQPVETPAYTGKLRPYKRAADERSPKPKRG